MASCDLPPCPQSTLSPFCPPEKKGRNPANGRRSPVPPCARLQVTTDPLSASGLARSLLLHGIITAYGALCAGLLPLSVVFSRLVRVVPVFDWDSGVWPNRTYSLSLIHQLQGVRVASTLLL